MMHKTEGYSYRSKLIAQEQNEDLKEKEKEELLQRKEKVRELSKQTNAIRKRLQNRLKSKEQQEEERRQKILKSRKLKQQIATEKFQRFPDGHQFKNEKNKRQGSRTGLNDGRYTVGGHTIEIKDGVRINSTKTQQLPDDGLFDENLKMSPIFQNSVYAPNSYLSSHLNKLLADSTVQANLPVKTMEQKDSNIITNWNEYYMNKDFSKESPAINQTTQVPYENYTEQIRDPPAIDNQVYPGQYHHHHTDHVNHSERLNHSDHVNRSDHVNHSDNVYQQHDEEKYTKFTPSPYGSTSSVDSLNEPINLRSSLRRSSSKNLSDKKVKFSSSIEFNDGKIDTLKTPLTNRVPLYKRIINTENEDNTISKMTTEDLLDQLRQDALLPKYPTNDDYNYPDSVNITSRPTNVAVVTPMMSSLSNDKQSFDEKPNTDIEEDSLNTQTNSSSGTCLFMDSLTTKDSLDVVKQSSGNEVVDSVDDINDSLESNGEEKLYKKNSKAEIKELTNMNSTITISPTVNPVHFPYTNTISYVPVTLTPTYGVSASNTNALYSNSTMGWVDNLNSRNIQTNAPENNPNQSNFQQSYHHHTQHANEHHAHTNHYNPDYTKSSASMPYLYSNPTTDTRQLVNQVSSETFQPNLHEVSNQVSSEIFQPKLHEISTLNDHRNVIATTSGFVPPYPRYSTNSVTQTTSSTVGVQRSLYQPITNSPSTNSTASNHSNYPVYSSSNPTNAQFLSRNEQFLYSSPLIRPNPVTTAQHNEQQHSAYMHSQVPSSYHHISSTTSQHADQPLTFSSQVPFNYNTGSNSAAAYSPHIYTDPIRYQQTSAALAQQTSNMKYISGDEVLYTNPMFQSTNSSSIQQQPGLSNQNKAQAGVQTHPDHRQSSYNSTSQMHGGGLVYSTPIHHVNQSSYPYEQRNGQYVDHESTSNQGNLTSQQLKDIIKTSKTDKRKTPLKKNDKDKNDKNTGQVDNFHTSNFHSTKPVVSRQQSIEYQTSSANDVVRLNSRSTTKKTDNCEPSKKAPTSDEIYKEVEKSLADLTFDNSRKRPKNTPHGNILEEDITIKQADTTKDPIRDAVRGGSAIPIRVHSNTVTRRGRIIVSADRKNRKPANGLTPHPPSNPKNLKETHNNDSVINDNNNTQNTDIITSNQSTPRENRTIIILRENSHENKPPKVHHKRASSANAILHRKPPIVTKQRPQSHIIHNHQQHFSRGLPDYRPKQFENQHQRNVPLKAIPLNKTPTDDEINKLWTNVRECLSQETPDHAYSDTQIIAARNPYTVHQRTMSGSILNRQSVQRPPYYRQQSNESMSSTNSFNKRQSLLPHRANKLIKQSVMSNQPVDQTSSRRNEGYHEPARKSNQVMSKYKEKEVTSSMASFLALEELCSKQSLTPRQTEAVFQASKHMIRKQQNLQPNQAMSALSVEERCVMESLDRLNRKLHDQERKGFYDVNENVTTKSMYRDYR